MSGAKDENAFRERPEFLKFLAILGYLGCLCLVIGTLREENALDDTIILFTGDHGDMPVHGIVLDAKDRPVRRAHVFLLPASALCGAILLLIADTLARTIVSPAELQIGILTALIGGPFFLMLLLKSRKEMSI